MMSGARTDNVTAPELAAELLLARRGQAFFSRKLNELRDEDFSAAALPHGWTRAHVAARVGFHARAITRLTEWAATGVETPMHASAAERDEEIRFGATLPVQAIRNLSSHAAVHLNVEWRDLPAEAWAQRVRVEDGRDVPVSETVWLRSREVWLRAVDLDNGARTDQFPPEIIDRFLQDIVDVWARRSADDAAPNIVLEPMDRPEAFRVHADHDPGLIVRGDAAELVAWGTGRGGRGVQAADGSPAPAAPPWA
jgi:maleylpyruvate isomerase